MYYSMKATTNGKERVINAFINGKPAKAGSLVTDGATLIYHGNPIAKWDGTLYISAGGYEGKGGATGSKTTKDILNQLPDVSIYQKNFQWYQHSNEWNGDWLNIGIPAPEINTAKIGDYYDKTEKYIKTDGWRGYSEPEFAVCGANDTGMWEDSPCRSDIAENELKEVADMLKSNGIESKEIVCESSNVFCVHRYLIVKVKDFKRAKELFLVFYDSDNTMLLYPCN